MASPLVIRHQTHSIPDVRHQTLDQMCHTDVNILYVHSFIKMHFSRPLCVDLKSLMSCETQIWYGCRPSLAVLHLQIPSLLSEIYCCII